MKKEQAAIFLGLTILVGLGIMNSRRCITNSNIIVDNNATLKQWLHRASLKNDACQLLERQVPKGEWYSDIKADDKPEFSLLSAWMKPEYPSGIPAPKEIPELYKNGFSMGGGVKVKSLYFNQAYLGGTALNAVWTKEMVVEMMEKVKNKIGITYGSAGLQVYEGLEKYKSFINGKKGIVIGSESPWVEAAALHNGASSVLTLEFGSIKSEHEQIETMIPPQFTEQFLNREIQPLDFGVSYSSLEHDGLGRYGDVLNPIGDLQSMAKMLTVIKPGGLFFLGVPAASVDKLEFNAHRIYGPLRLPKLFAGWKFIDIVRHKKQGMEQPLFVLQNLNGCTSARI